jgi:hypothetical protein
MTVATRGSIGAVWQISGGPASRAYSDAFIRHGVALIGPGDAGEWSSERYSYDFALSGFVGRFATELAIGDIILLRTGVSTISAVGLVASDYLYLEQFDDVNGLDLQHARRVHWCKLAEEHTFQAPVFGASPTRCSRVLQAEAIDFAERYLKSPPIHWQTAPLPELPAEEPLLTRIPAALQGIVAQAADLVPLLQDRGTFGEHPSEDEMIAHFVVPFLRALGWPPERIAIKWHYIDIAVFRASPRTPENCHFLIEAKRLGAGVEGALDQAKRYVDALGVQRDVVVTDGIRYRMYSGEREFAHVAYANLARLKQSAAELFARMQKS